MPPQSEIDEAIPRLSNLLSQTMDSRNVLRDPVERLLAYNNLAIQNEAQPDIAGSGVSQNVWSQITTPEGSQQSGFRPLVMYGMLISQIVDLKNIIQKIRNKLKEIDDKQKSISSNDDFDHLMKNFDDSVGHLKNVCENVRLEDAPLADRTLLLLAKIERAKMEMIEELEKTRSDDCKMTKNLFASFYVRYMQWKIKFDK